MVFFPTLKYIKHVKKIQKSKRHSSEHLKQTHFTFLQGTFHHPSIRNANLALAATDFVSLLNIQNITGTRKCTNPENDEPIRKNA